MTTPTPINILERVTRDVEFADEADARRYFKRQTASGFLPAAPYLSGIGPTHHLDDTVTWTVHIEKQTYNGEVTPAYHEGDRVVADLSGFASDQPTAEGTITYAYGHQIKVRLDSPGADIECQDYEVRPAA